MTVLIKSIEQWRALRGKLDMSSLGFVPTMGDLHEGHMALVARSVRENKTTVLSCFVNPTQFNNANDFGQYPRSLEEDLALCEAANVDYFFIPRYADIYPDDYRYQVVENELSMMMEGKYRPGHFEGMLTVVLKLLLLIRPTRAYFGEKDFQQLQLVRGMAEAFFLETEIVPCPIVRNEFDLALSSRNRHLTEEQMAMAVHFPEYFHSNRSCEDIAAALESKGFKVDYIKEHQGRRFAAVYLGDVRLIDTIDLGFPLAQE